MEEKKKDSGFVIKDKRFSGDSEESRPAEEKPKTAAEDKRESANEPQSPPEPEFDFPVNFSNFVLSLSTSALYHFGDFPETEGAKPQKNLPAVKQTIDILDMLHEKTKGNLDANEANLIQGVIYELKMRYVKEKA
ncbi:MAG TPA: DUF1844 domain-containing protein [Deltaproteobacteria bacterium]|nr:DUF1844 domain-containing protein [Deltaproteobacteria bacterium]